MWKMILAAIMGVSLLGLGAFVLWMAGLFCAVIVAVVFAMECAMLMAIME